MNGDSHHMLGIRQGNYFCDKEMVISMNLITEM
jgi:hypothetical protein